MNSTMRNKISAGVVAVVGIVLFTASGAWATPSTADQVTSMATTAFGEATPIVIAVAGAAVALAVALFGSRLVLRAIRGGGKV